MSDGQVPRYSPARAVASFYLARTRVTPEVLTRTGGIKPSASAPVLEMVDVSPGSMVETVDVVVGAVGDVRSVERAAGDIVCRIGV